MPLKDNMKTCWISTDGVWTFTFFFISSSSRSTFLNGISPLQKGWVLHFFTSPHLFFSCFFLVMTTGYHRKKERNKSCWCSVWANGSEWGVTLIISVWGRSGKWFEGTSHSVTSLFSPKQEIPHKLLRVGV